METLLKLLKPYRGRLVAVAITDATGMIMTLCMPYIMSKIIEDGIAKEQISVIIQSAIIMLMLSVTAIVTSLIANRINSHVTVGYTADLQRLVFARINSLSYHQYAGIGPSGLLTRATDDIFNIEGAASSLVYTIVTVPIMLIGSAVLAMLADWVLALVFMAVIPPVMLVIWLIMRPLYDMWDRSDHYVDEQNKIVRERLSGLRVVRAFNNEHREHGRARFATEEMAKYMIRANVRGGYIDPIAMMLLNIATVATVAVGGWRAEAGLLSDSGAVVAIVQYVALISGALLNLSWTIAWLPRLRVSIGRINEILKMPAEDGGAICATAVGSKGEEASPETTDGSKGEEASSATTDGSVDGGEASLADRVDDADILTAAEQSDSTGATRLTAAEQSDSTGATQPTAHEKRGASIELCNVYFTYPEGRTPTLYDVSMRVNEGERVAIIGGTGAGKTTLVRILLSLFDVDCGEVRIDGRPYSEMTKGEVRRHYSVALQRGMIFEGTLGDNVRMGHPEATDDEVISALTDCEMGGYLTECEDGLDYLLVGSGRNVSGGQKQRINMARTVIRPAEVYIFDDSFSALDFLTESRIREKLSRRLEGRTQITVTQRVGTAMSAERIFVMDGGRIVAVGNHRELLEGSDIYREICISQLGADALGGER